MGSVMDQTTSASPEPALAATPGLEPEINVPKTRPVELYLVTTETEAECNFWVGLARQGGHSPAQLMDLSEVPSLLTEAAIRGVDEQGPLMLSDSSRTPPRYVYLLPVPRSDFRDRAIWIHDLVGAIKSWAPPSAGLYIAPQLLDSAEAHDLLLSVLREAIRNTTTEEYYLLTGTHGLNSVMNAALRLKAEMDSETLSLHVFH